MNETNRGLPASTSMAHRKLARSVWMALSILAAIAIIGPLVSYRSDLAVNRTQIRTKVAREATVYAASLWLHLQVLEAELERVAQRPEVDLLDGKIGPEQAVLQLSHQDSALFNGVSFLDRSGHVAWSEPADAVREGQVFHSRRWFQRVLASQHSAIDALGGTGGSLAVAVPVIRKHQSTGLLLGTIDASSPIIPEGLMSGDHLWVVGSEGELIVPHTLPAWAKHLDFEREFRQLLASTDVEDWKVGRSRFFAAAAHVGTSGLKVLFFADAERVVSPIRARLLEQLGFVAVLQLATLVLFSLFLRRTYRAFLSIEARAMEQEKMAALGSAASLIAHEIRNSLNGLSAATGLLSRSPETEFPVQAIRGQVDRLGHLARSLLSFGRPAGAQLRDVRLDELALEALEGLKVLPEAADAQLTTQLTEPLPAMADPLLLHSSIDNLIRNAIEAAVAAHDLGKVSTPVVTVRGRREGSDVLLEVDDNAGGLSPEVETKLFVPFTTSKAKGIGLGLAMARQAVVTQGGTLSFQRLNDGSRFTLRLKASKVPAHGAD